MIHKGGVEVAPGVDIERDILAHEDFVPRTGDIQPMDPRIFIDAPIAPREDFLTLSMAQHERCMDDSNGYPR